MLGPFWDQALKYPINHLFSEHSLDKMNKRKEILKVLSRNYDNVHYFHFLDLIWFIWLFFAAASWGIYTTLLGLCTIGWLGTEEGVLRQIWHAKPEHITIMDLRTLIFAAVGTFQCQKPSTFHCQKPDIYTK